MISYVLVFQFVYWCFPRTVGTLSLLTGIVTHYLITYLLAYSMEQVLLEKLTGLQLVKKFPAFNETWKFITTFTSARQLSLSCASPIQSITPHSHFLKTILILSYYLRPCLSSGLFPSGFPTKPCTLLYSPHTRYMPRPPHSSRFYHPHNIGWGIQITKLLTM